MPSTRMKSCVLATCPFQSGILHTNDDLSSVGEAFPDLEGFISRLSMYERSLFSVGYGGNQVVGRMQRVLGLGTELNLGASISSVRPITGSTQDTYRLCQLLICYSAVDLVVKLSGKGVPKISIPRCVFPDSATKLKNLQDLYNWPELLISLRSDMSGLQTTRPNHVALDAPLAEQLLHEICSGDSTVRIQKFKTNVHVLTLNLLLLLTSPQAYSELTGVASTPETILAWCSFKNDLVAHRSATSDGTTSVIGQVSDPAAVLERIKKLSSGNSSDLRSALPLCLLISPLYLFVNRQLHTKSFSRTGIVDYFFSCGNSKPDILLRAESQIWLTIFAVVEGKISLHDAPAAIIASLPYDDLIDLAPHDHARRWFDPQFNAALEEASRKTPAVQIDSTEELALSKALHPRLRASGDLAPMHIQQVSHDCQTPNIQPTAPSSTEMPHGMPTTSNTRLKNKPDEVDSQQDAIGKSNDDLGRYSMEYSDSFEQRHDIHFGGNDIGPSHAENGPKDLFAPSLLSQIQHQTNTTLALDAPPHNSGLSTDMSDHRLPHRGVTPESEDADGETSTQNSPPRSNSPAEEPMDLDPSENPLAKNTRSQHRVHQNIDGQTQSEKSALPKSGLATKPAKKRKRSNKNVARSHTSRIVPTNVDDSVENTEEEDAEPENVFERDILYSPWDPASSSDFARHMARTQLDINSIPPRQCEVETYEVFDLTGTVHSARAAFHQPDYGKRLATFYKTYQQKVQGTPLHIAEPHKSAFAVMSYNDYKDMATVNISDVLRNKCIVLHGAPYKATSFDEAALTKLQPMQARICIQDYSFPPEGSTASAPMICEGDVADLLAQAQLGQSGKILNGLDFPRWNVAVDTDGFNTDAVAWHETNTAHRCSLDSVFPVKDMNWAIVGCKDAVTWIHIDCNGLGTWIQVQCGMKFWGIVRLKTGGPIHDISAFLKDFELDSIGFDSKYDVEFLALRPGDVLIMPPNQPHIVYGPQNTICYGSHYYSTGLLPETTSGIIHAFVLNKFLTNTTHVKTRTILRRMAIFFYMGIFEKKIPSSSPSMAHLPDISTIGGVVQLLSLCNLVILGNVVDFRSYSAPNEEEDGSVLQAARQLVKDCDRSDIVAAERLAMCYARGVARVVVDFVADNATLRRPDGSVDSDLPLRFLASQMQAIATYKGTAMSAGRHGAPHCNTAAVKLQLHNICQWYPAVNRRYSQLPKTATLRLDVGDVANYNVEWDSQAFDLTAPHDFLQIGTTQRDTLFFNSERAKMNQHVPAEKKSGKRPKTSQ